MVEVRFTSSFERRFKNLFRRYRQIKQDIEPIIRKLQEGNFIGDQITGTTATVFKVRGDILLHRIKDYGVGFLSFTFRDD